MAGWYVIPPDPQYIAMFCAVAASQMFSTAQAVAAISSISGITAPFHANSYKMRSQVALGFQFIVVARDETGRGRERFIQFGVLGAELLHFVAAEHHKIPGLGQAMGGRPVGQLH